MTKYEYHSTAVHGTDLAEKGQEGWHLVGVNHESMFWQRVVQEAVKFAEEVVGEAEPAAVETEPAPIPRRRGRRPKVRV